MAGTQRPHGGMKSSNRLLHDQGQQPDSEAGSTDLVHKRMNHHNSNEIYISFPVIKSVCDL